MRLNGALDHLGDQKRQHHLLRRAEFRSLTAAVGEECGQFAAVAILNIGGMHNRIQQQAYRISRIWRFFP